MADACAAPTSAGAARPQPPDPPRQQAAADMPKQAAPDTPKQSGAGCPPRAALAVAALSFVPKQRSADVWFVPLAGGAPTKVASVDRAPDTPVTATAISGTDLVAVVTSPRRDKDVTWSGALAVDSPGHKPRALLANVHAGGTPVAAPTGTVYVVRGGAGPERDAADPSPGYRRDTLELVAVDARSGTVRVVGKDSGDALFLIGLLGEELVAYRVGAAGSSAASQSGPRPLPRSSSL